MEIVRNALAKRGMFGDPRKISGPDGLAANLTPFTSTNGTLWARRYDGFTPPESLGRHCGGYGSFMTHLDLGDGIEPVGPLYVVYSYGTPIAWVDWWGIVNESKEDYSLTTKMHKGQLVWLGKKNVVVNQSGDLLPMHQWAVSLRMRGEWM